MANPNVFIAARCDRPTRLGEFLFGKPSRPGDMMWFDRDWWGSTMAGSHDDQLSLDLGIEIRHTDQAWRDWVEPARRAAAADRFRERIGVTGRPKPPWGEETVESARIACRIDRLFPDGDALRAPENGCAVDEFASYLVNCCQRWAGAEVANYPVCDLRNTLFPSQPDVNPILIWPFDPESLTVWGLLRVMTYDGAGFATLSSILSLRCTSYLKWCLDNDGELDVH